MDVSNSKTELREKLKQQRRKISGNELNLISKTITNHLLTHPAVLNAQHINCFVGDDNRQELSTSLFIDSVIQLGKIVSVPIMKKYFELDYGQIFTLEDLEMNKWGISEPKEFIQPITEPDVIIVPMLAADLDKNRLGYGAGYYDRFLTKFSTCTRIGIVAQSFIFKKLPTDFYDIPLDIILTESSIIE